MSTPLPAPLLRLLTGTPSCAARSGLRLGLVVLLVLALPALAHAQDYEVGIDDGGAPPTAQVTITNTLDFAWDMGGVRIRFRNPDGSSTFFYATPDAVERLGPTGTPEGTWQGELTFVDAEGEPASADEDLENYDSVSVAAGLDLEAWRAEVEALVAQGTEAILNALPDLRTRERLVSRSGRIHREQLERAGFPIAGRFDHEEAAAILRLAEEAACEGASQRILRASARQREAIYRSETDALGEHRLTPNCLNDEARMAAAQALLRGDRPEDASVFRMRDSEGEFLPGWEEVYIGSRIGVLETGASMERHSLASARSLIRSMNDLREAVPDDPRLRRHAATIIPRIARLAEEMLDRNDIADAETVFAMLRPDWEDYADLTQASAKMAEALLEEGMREARAGRYINARNRFVRGNRLLEGVPEWEEHRDEINRYRALGMLEEAYDTARDPVDPRALERARERLDEARRHGPLTEEDIETWLVTLSGIALERAEADIAEGRFSAAEHALQRAEEFHPDGRTESIREMWMEYAEAHFGRTGFLSSGAQIDHTREAIALSDAIDSARAEALEARLTTAYYGYRLGVPAGTLLLLLLGFMLYRISNRKGRFEIDDVA